MLSTMATPKTTEGWEGIEAAEALDYGFPLRDIVFIAGSVFPGTAKVTTQKVRRVEVNTAPGVDGATLRDLGYEASKVEIAVRVWTQPQLNALDKRVKTVLVPRKDDKGREQAVDIQHPALAMLGISKIVVKSVGSLNEVSPGIYEMRISAVEYVARRDDAPRASVKGSIARPTAFDSALQSPSSGALQSLASTNRSTPGDPATDPTALAP